MWKADFDTVDEAISDGFEKDKRFVVLWVEDNLLEFALEMVLSMRTRHAFDMQMYLESLEVVHPWSALGACGLICLCNWQSVQTRKSSISTGYKWYCKGKDRHAREIHNRNCLHVHTAVCLKSRDEPRPMACGPAFPRLEACSANA